MIIIKDIKNKPGAIPAGTVNFYLVPWKQIYSIPEPDMDGKISGNILLKADYQFKKWEFAEGNCELSNPTSGDSASAYFTTQIEILILKDDQDNLMMFSKMLNGLFIGLLDQRSKSIKLAGSLSVPLLCKSIDIKYGKDQADILGTIFAFEARTGPVLEYNGEINPVAVSLQLALINKVNVTVNGGSNGTIEVSASGGFPPYTYSKGGGIYQSTGLFSNLSAATFTITAKDAINTITSLEVVVTQPAAANLYGILYNGTWENNPNLSVLSGYEQYYDTSTEYAHTGIASGRYSSAVTPFDYTPVLPVHPSSSSYNNLGRYHAQAWVLIPSDSPILEGASIKFIRSTQITTNEGIFQTAEIVSQTDYIISNSNKGEWQHIEVIFDLINNEHSSPDSTIWCRDGYVSGAFIFIDDISLVQTS